MANFTFTKKPEVTTAPKAATAPNRVRVQPKPPAARATGMFALRPAVAAGGATPAVAKTAPVEPDITSENSGFDASPVSGVSSQHTGADQGPRSIDEPLSPFEGIELQEQNARAEEVTPAQSLSDSPTLAEPLVEQPLGKSPAKFSFLAPVQGDDEAEDESPPSYDYGYDSVDEAEISRGDGSEYYEGIVPQLGIGRRALGLLCGIPESAYDGFSPHVPPGSHYEEWVWNAMDREGHVTIELYLDAQAHVATPETSILERAYKTKAQRAIPVFDPSMHCLISIPVPSQAPWGIATRVLLTPQTVRRMVTPARKARTVPARFDKPERTFPATPERVNFEVDPAGVSTWLHQNPHHGVIFGQCEIAQGTQDHGSPYWMMISKADARRIHAQVYGESLGKHTDPEHKFGLPGVVASEEIADESTGRSTFRAVPSNRRQATPAAKRYFGLWSEDSAVKVIQAAAHRLGPVMPADWSAEDVREVAMSHASNREQVAREEKVTIVAPNADLGIELPEDKPEELKRSNDTIIQQRGMRPRF